MPNAADPEKKVRANCTLFCIGSPNSIGCSAAAFQGSGLLADVNTHGMTVSRWPMLWVNRFDSFTSHREPNFFSFSFSFSFCEPTIGTPTKQTQKKEERERQRQRLAQFGKKSGAKPSISIDNLFGDKAGGADGFSLGLGSSNQTPAPPPKPVSDDFGAFSGAAVSSMPAAPPGGNEFGAFSSSAAAPAVPSADAFGAFSGAVGAPAPAPAPTPTPTASSGGDFGAFSMAAAPATTAAAAPEKASIDINSMMKGLADSVSTPPTARKEFAKPEKKTMETMQVCALQTHSHHNSTFFYFPRHAR